MLPDKLNGSTKGLASPVPAEENMWSSPLRTGVPGTSYIGSVSSRFTSNLRSAAACSSTRKQSKHARHPIKSATSSECATPCVQDRCSVESAWTGAPAGAGRPL
eukprot:6207358-Pleurochrysis_carterae.AAC.1